MVGVSTDLVVSCAAYVMFLFYQHKHRIELKGDREFFSTFLAYSAAIATSFYIAALLYLGYAVSWWTAGNLLAASTLLSIPAVALGGLITRAISPILPYVASVGGFIALPILAYGILKALP